MCKCPGLETLRLGGDDSQFPGCVMDGGQEETFMGPLILFLDLVIRCHSSFSECGVVPRADEFAANCSSRRMNMVNYQELGEGVIELNRLNSLCLSGDAVASVQDCSRIKSMARAVTWHLGSCRTRQSLPCYRSDRNLRNKHLEHLGIGNQTR
ncbi:hypothetical protein L209DRAFT_331263 [Thermothelomyces heterothallicus CBS 203.75]